VEICDFPTSAQTVGVSLIKTSRLSNAGIDVMQAAEDGLACDFAVCLDRSRNRRVFV